MFNHPPRIRRVLAPSVLWVSAAAWAQQPIEVALVAPGEPLPARMVMCQREVGAQQANRSNLLHACLVRRLEGERAVDLQCRSKTGAVKGGTARQQARRECERVALAVPSSQLPR